MLDKGFCIPTAVGANGNECMAYWQKVGVIDTGLDLHICPELDYDTSTGLCSDWHPASVVHPDLNHNSNLNGNCVSGLVGSEGLDPLGDCKKLVIRDTFILHRPRR